MTTFNTIINILFSSISVFINMLAYNKLSRNSKFKLTIPRLLMIIITGVIAVINTYFNDNIIRIIVTFLMLFVCSKLVFKDDFIKTILYVLVCYILMTLYEVVLAGVFIGLNVINVSLFDKSIIIKNAFSIGIVLLVYLTCISKSFSSKINKIYKSLRNKNVIILILLFLVLIALIIADFVYTRNITKSVYICNLIIAFCFLSIFIYSIYNYFKVINEMEKSNILLNFMSKYEKMIDEQRINKHEMLNNLLYLKSIEDKNSKEYEDELNDLITTYNKKGIGIKNIYNLPSGLKGIFYYKLNGLEDKNFNININISKQISNSLKNISHDDYVILYKIVGILLDNAIESAEKTKDKIINVEIYRESNIIYIIIDNSFKGKIDINKIGNKNYSTKGNNRGLGLFIINNLLKNSNSISLEQDINNNIFTSKVIINKKKN